MFDILSPKWKNTEVSKRLEEVKKTDNENLLQGIVLYDVDEQVRMTALERITKDELLHAILLEGPEEKVIDKIIEKINDDNILVRILGEYKNIEKLQIIIKKVKNKSKLSELLIRSKNEILKEILIHEIEDQEVLYSTVLLNQENDIGLKASEVITEEKYLKLLFKNVRVKEIKLNLIKNMGDDTFLNKIVASNKKDFAELAVKNIKNDDMLTDIAMTNIHNTVKLEAINLIKRKTSISKVARKEINNNLRLAAVSRLENQNDLEYFAINDKFTDIRVKAIESIESEDFLLELLKKEYNIVVKKAIQERLGSNELLIITFNKTKSKAKKKTILNKITDQNIIKDIVQTEKFRFVRRKAIKKLEDQPLLKEIAIDKNEQPGTRITALKNIKTDDTLLKLASNCNNKQIKYTSIASLNDNEKFLKDIISKDSDILSVKAALYALKNQNIIFQTSLVHELDEIKIYAAKRLKDTKLLKNVYNKSSNSKMKSVIFKKLPMVYKQLLQEENYYLKVISSLTTKKDKVNTLDKIISQRILSKIVVESVDKIIKMLAIKKITNREILEDLKTKIDDHKIIELIDKKINKK